MMKKMYKNDIRLNSVSGVNRLIQRTINALIQDEISENKARTLGYLANIAIKGLEAGELEERIIKIENSINKANIKKVG